MTTETLVQSLAVGTNKFGGGRMFYIKTLTSAVTIRAVTIGTGGTVRKFVNVGAGTKFTIGKGEAPFTYLEVDSTVIQNLEIIIGNDDVEIANAVSVTGFAVTQDAPSSTVTDTADTSQASASQTVISANASRRRITIGVLSSSNNSVRVSSAGGTGRGIEIQPGNFVEFKTTASLTVRNDNTFGTAAAASWYAEEE